MQSIEKKEGRVYGIFALIRVAIFSIITFIPILFLGLAKLIPIRGWQDKCTRSVDKLVTFWCSMNNLYLQKTQKTKLNIIGLDSLKANNWHLVIANHQSWLDILILQQTFNRKIPVLKFFIKDQLKWLPLFGFAWWAMGCPFMKRYSKEYLARKPHKQGKDIKATRKAIETFKRTPASVMNFVEGTRFTSAKKKLQDSPYTHLLKPKAGGISFIISSMGKQISHLLDVTIVYSHKKHSLWDFLCQRIHEVTVCVREIPIPIHFLSPKLVEDNQIQTQFKEWLNQQWTQKDHLIASLK